MIWFSVSTVSGDNLFKSKFPRLGKNSKNRSFSFDNQTIEVETNDSDLVRSSRLLSKVGPIANSIFDQLYESFRGQIEAQAHTLKKIQAQLSQKIEQVVVSPLSHGKYGYSEQKKLVSKKIAEDPEQAAEMLIYLSKRISELDAHMSSFELIHMGEFIKLDKQMHNIRRLLLNIWHAFDGQFYKKSIKYSLAFQDSFAEENKLHLDYNTINTAFYNFFDNCSKYASPNSEIKIDFSVDEENRFNITISMKSFLIEESEIDKIFELGFRCKSCSKIDGSGVGLHVFKKVLEMHGFQVYVESDGQMTNSDDKNIYSNNTFVISGELV